MRTYTPFTIETIENLKRLISVAESIYQDRAEASARARAKNLYGRLNSAVKLIEGFSSMSKEERVISSQEIEKCEASFHEFVETSVLTFLDSAVCSPYDLKFFFTNLHHHHEQESILIQIIEYRIGTFFKNYRELYGFLCYLSTEGIDSFLQAIGSIGLKKIVASITKRDELEVYWSIMCRLLNYYKSIPFSKNSLREIAVGRIRNILQQNNYVRIFAQIEEFFRIFNFERILKNANEWVDFLGSMLFENKSLCIQMLGFERIAAILNITNIRDPNEKLKLLFFIFDSLSAEQVISFIQGVNDHWCDLRLRLVEKDSIPDYLEMLVLAETENRKPILIKNGNEYRLFGKICNENLSLSWEFTDLDREICEKFAGQFSKWPNQTRSLPCHAHFSELYDHIKLKKAHANDRILDFIGGLWMLYNILGYLNPEQRKAFLQPLGKRISSFVLFDLSFDEHWSCALKSEGIIACIDAIVPDMCQHISGIEKLANIYWRLSEEISKYIMQIMYPLLVKTDKEHGDLVSSLKPGLHNEDVQANKIKFLDELYQKTFGIPFAHSQQLKMVHEPSFEWDDTKSLLENLKRLFTEEKGIFKLTPLRSIDETTQPSPEIVQSLVNYFQTKLEEIEKLRSIGSSGLFPAPLEKSDVALRLQFAVGKLQKQLEELLFREEEVSPSQVAKLSFG